MKRFILLGLLLANTAFGTGHLQNIDFATCAQIMGAGGTCDQLLNTSNIWDDVHSQILDVTLSSLTGGTVTTVSVVSANGLAGTVANPTTTPAITLSTTITGILQGNGTAISAATTGNLTDAGTDGITVTNGTGAVLGTGTSLSQHVADATHNGYLSSVDWSTFNSKLSTALTSAHIFVGNGANVATDVAVSGDLSLANTGAFTINNLAVTNAKIANATIDLTTKVTNVLPIANGGTNGSTKTTAFDNLSPTTTKGDLIVNDGTNNVRQAVGADTFVLTADSAQATGIKWAAAGSGSSQTTIIAPNDTTIGTVVNSLAYFNVVDGASTGHGLITPPTTGATGLGKNVGIVGIVTSGAGTAGNATVVTSGLVNCVFDGATTANHYVVASATTPGDCHDDGGTSGGQTGYGSAFGFPSGVIGSVLTTNGGAGTYQILLYPQALGILNVATASGSAQQYVNYFPAINAWQFYLANNEDQGGFVSNNSTSPQYLAGSKEFDSNFGSFHNIGGSGTVNQITSMKTNNTPYGELILTGSITTLNGIDGNSPNGLNEGQRIMVCNYQGSSVTLTHNSGSATNTGFDKMIFKGAANFTLVNNQCIEFQWSQFYNGIAGGVSGSWVYIGN